MCLRNTSEGIPFECSYDFKTKKVKQMVHVIYWKVDIAEEESRIVKRPNDSQLIQSVEEAKLASLLLSL